VDRPCSSHVFSTTSKEQSNLSGERQVNTSDVCKKSFKGQSRLKAHQRAYSGEHPLACDVCNKSFTEQGHLKARQDASSGEHPFAC
jgi:uncharacterized Zn-finger protein